MRLGLDLLFLVPGESGGRETYTRELVRALHAVDPTLELTAFTNRESAGWVRELGVPVRAVVLGVSPRRPDHWALGELAALPAAARRAGVALVHSPANFGPVGGRFVRVITLHDLQYRAVPELLTPARRLGTGALIPVMARRAHRLITGAATARDEIVRELGVPAERIDVIPHGVVQPPSGTRISEPRLRAELELGERPLVLTVATALPHTNLGRLLEALAVIEPARRPVLAVSGAGTDGPELSDQVAALSLRTDVRLLGFAPRATLEALYATAACVVIPTLYEGFGLPVIEAMARGTPVACSDIPVLREVAADAACFFDPRRPAAIAEAMLGLIEQPARARRYADAGRRRAAGFTWEATARATIATYRRALSARR
jgi:glycosyltransferase involved in cell wall biosynthesis